MHPHGSRTGKRPPAAELADNELVYSMYVYEPTCMEWREGGVRWSMEMGPLPPSLHCTLLPLFSHGTLSSSNRVIDSPLTHSPTGSVLALQELSPTCRHLACFLPPNSGRVSCVSDNLSFDGQLGKLCAAFAYPVATNKMPSSTALLTP